MIQPDENDIISGAIDAFLGKPKFTITIPIINPLPPKPIALPERTFWDKILLRPSPIQEYEAVELERVFIINPCVVGNMYRIAGRAVKLPDELKDGSLYATVLPIIDKHLKDIVYMVASAIQNNRHEPTVELIEFIEDNFDSEDLYNTLHPVLESVGMKSFLNSIVLAKGTTLMLKPSASPLEGRESIASQIVQ